MPMAVTNAMLNDLKVSVFKLYADRHFKVAFVLLICIYILGISACEQGKRHASLLTLGGLTMGTTYSIKISDPDPGLAVADINVAVDNILADINWKMSTYIKDSELSRINQTLTRNWLPVSNDLYQVISDAISVSRLTHGSFDITVGPLVNLWGFGPGMKPRRVPPDPAISKALAKTGFEHIHLRKSPMALKKSIADIYIDLSAIAKGYAVDRVAEYLTQQHINNYMVEIGGEIRASGVNEINFAWRIGIERPVPEKRSVERIIKLDNMAMATSGDYRNYFEQDGKRYSHTIDPRTGRPIKRALASVTVLHRSTAQADALATAFMVMGRDAAFRLAQQQHLAVFFIVHAAGGGFSETYTRDFAPYLLRN